MHFGVVAVWAPADCPVMIQWLPVATSSGGPCFPHLAGGTELGVDVGSPGAAATLSPSSIPGDDHVEPSELISAIGATPPSIVAATEF